MNFGVYVVEDYEAQSEYEISIRSGDYYRVFETDEDKVNQNPPSSLIPSSSY